MSSEQYCDG